MTLMERSRILIVDNDEATLASLQRLLQNDYEVVVTTVWEHGFDLLGQGEYAVIIASDTLPWLGGVEFLQRAHAVKPHTCRILIGNSPKNDRAITAINNARVHYYLNRPWQGVAFKKIVAQEVCAAGEQQRLVYEHHMFQQMLVDERTGLKSRALAIKQASESLQKQGFLGVLWLDASKLWGAQQVLKKCDRDALQQRLFAALHDLHKKHLRSTDLLTIDDIGTPRFSLFMGPPRDERVGTAEDAQQLAMRLRLYLGSMSLSQQLAPAIGHGFALFDPRLDPIFQVQQALDDARDTARGVTLLTAAPKRFTQLQEIISERRVHSLFQPIITLSTGQVTGYEALSRGPAGGIFESPELLLSVADEAGLTFELDRLFRSMALTNAVELPRHVKIFVNTLASSAHDPELAAQRLGRFLEQLDIDPTRVVFEFSERCNIADHDVLLDTLQHYRALGVQLAIDDVGAGYSGLERIVALRPDYLKIDRTLVQGIHAVPVKRAVLQALVNLARSLEAAVIAEGIEERADADCLVDLGVQFGQGFFFGPPAHATPPAWSNMGPGFLHA